MKTDDLIIEQEQDLIGAILADNECFDLVEVKPHNLLIVADQLILAAIAELVNDGKSADIITVAELLEKRGDLAKVGGLKYIGELIQNSVASKATIKGRSDSIMNGYKRRKLAVLADSITEKIKAKEDVSAIVESAQTGFDEIVDNGDDERIAHIKSAVAEAVEWEDAEFRGVQTGLRDLDRLLGGLGNSDLVIIAARPSMGKSTLACQIAEHVSNRESVVIFSLEMPKRQIAQRFLRFHENRVGKSQAINHLYQLKMHIDDTPAITLGHIRSKCRQIQRKHGLSMIVVDYIQLMRGEGANRNQEIGSISRGLKAIAKDFDIPVVALSQLSRKVEERADKRPVMSDLRESGEIEQDADIILFIYREEVYDQETEFKGVAEILCKKHRNGAIGDITTKFSGETTRFSDYNGERILRSVKQTKRGFE